MMNKIKQALRSETKLSRITYKYIIRSKLLVPINLNTDFGNWLTSSQNSILMYHSVGENEKGYPGNISSEKFKKDIEYIRERAHIVPLSEITNHEDKQTVAITFDDGYISFYSDVFPILKKYKIPATVFINPLFIGDNNKDKLIKRHRMNRSEMKDKNIIMSNEKIQELSDTNLIEIGNHTMSHPDLSKITKQSELHKEIIESKNWLESRYDISVTSFAYPGGHFDQNSKRLVENTHDIAVTTIPRSVNEDDPHELPRIHGHRTHEEVCWELTPVSNKIDNCLDLF